MNKTNKVYAFRVLFRYEGALAKPTAAQVQSYLEESLGSSRVSVPRKLLLTRREGKVVVLGENDVSFSVVRVLVPAGRGA